MLPRSLKLIEHLAQQPIQPVTIQKLLEKTKDVSQTSNIRHAQALHREFPLRIAHRLADFHQLPYIALGNSKLNAVYGQYVKAFEDLTEFPLIHDAEGEEQFAQLLISLVRENAGVILSIQEGFRELQTVDEWDLDDFLDRFFITRVGSRVLAQHYLALRGSPLPTPTVAIDKEGMSERVGVVHPCCHPAGMVEFLAEPIVNICKRVYGCSAEVILEGQLGTTIPFIPEHLHFILQELIKNACRATVENHLSSGQKGNRLPPVRVEIFKGSHEAIIKISDEGGGMKPNIRSRVWKYGYTTVDDESNDVDPSHTFHPKIVNRELAGYGFGLPLSRVYAQYFGGDIHIQTMHGYGTDVYLHTNHRGDAFGDVTEWGTGWTRHVYHSWQGP